MAKKIIIKKGLKKESTLREFKRQGFKKKDIKKKEAARKAAGSRKKISQKGSSDNKADNKVKVKTVSYKVGSEQQHGTAAQRIRPDRQAAAWITVIEIFWIIWTISEIWDSERFSLQIIFNPLS